MRLSEQKVRGGFKGGAFAALLLVGVAAGSAILLAPAGHKAFAGGDRCGIPDDMVLAARPLPHVAARLANGGTLTIVALGSSSTSGTGASKPEKTYPSRLASVLAEADPGVTVRVINRGVAGEEALAMASRIERDVLREKPDLVIWQVGTNGVLRDDGAAKLGEVVRAGTARLKVAGADVMIMNPQYAPAVLQHPHYREVLHALDAVAYAEDVPLFPRFAMMRHWVEDGRMPLGMMLTPDRLHMTDVSYDCLARQIAASIAHIVEQQPAEARQIARLNG